MAAQITAQVPNGRYALTFTDTGVTRFFKVNTPTQGKWKGYTFLTLLVANGGHGVESLAEYPVRDKGKRAAVMAILAQDVAGASARFGQHIGACGVCGRVLTDEDSRAAGIGPICQGKMGW